ncbi:MAG: cyclic nucleotide-binding serine/threonine-protein kinase [Desulfocapsaceae bacterium]|nr:cyclic nucleotide-binding serine/threonine-protein kinase [Desulfocapsaceae bacterium]
MEVTDLQTEQQIHELIIKGESEKGKQFLVEIITQMARKRNFIEADKFHRLLIEAFPLALNEIIRATEILEQEKTAAIDKNQLAVWSALLRVLDFGEFVVLYHSMERRRCAQGEMLVRQGAQNSDLYFVNNGRIELYFQETGKKIPLKVIGAGEILGAGSFFEASVWTINARSLGAEVSTLKFDTLQQLERDFPGIDSKLNDFCSRFKISSESFGKTGSDRRMYTRYRLSGITQMILFDRDGNNTGIVAKGDLFDISAGGISFFVRISKKKNARLLLGRHVGLTITSEPGSRFNIGGVVRAVRSQPIVGNEYAVSIQFERVLAQKELKNLINAAQDNGARR